MEEVIRVRGELSQALFGRIRDPAALGLVVPDQQLSARGRPRF
jgi:hypothetical protein